MAKQNILMDLIGGLLGKSDVADTLTDVVESITVGGKEGSSTAHQTGKQKASSVKQKATAAKARAKAKGGVGRSSASRSGGVHKKTR